MVCGRYSSISKQSVLYKDLVREKTYPNLVHHLVTFSVIPHPLTTVPSDGSDQNEHSNKESKKPKDQTTQIDWLEEHPLPDQDEVVDACGLRPLTPMRECYEEPPKRITTSAGRFKEVSLPSGKHFYQETLLAHAQVYVFAEYHLVEKLQRLALQRLNQVLLHQDCTQAHAVSETVSTIRYIYNNTTKQESHEPIRKLVSQFAVFHYVDLMKDEFEDLPAEGGDFALDVARKLRRRLAVSEKCPEEQNQLLGRRLIRSIS